MKGHNKITKLSKGMIKNESIYSKWQHRRKNRNVGKQDKHSRQKWFTKPISLTVDYFRYITIQRGSIEFLTFKTGQIKGQNSTEDMKTRVLVICNCAWS